MNAKLVRLLLGALLVIPVCLTGAVTAFQFQENLAVNADDAPAVPAAETRPATEQKPAAPALPVEAATDVAASKAEEPAAAAQPTPVVPAPAATEEDAAQNQTGVTAKSVQFVRLMGDGYLPGRLQVVHPLSRGLVSVKRATVSFLQNGKIISQARPGIDGIFQIGGLQPGVYSVIASGEDGFLAMGVEVLPALDPAQAAKAPAGSTEDFLQLDAVMVPPRDVRIVKRIMQLYMGGIPAKSSARVARRGNPREVPMIAAAGLRRVSFADQRSTLLTGSLRLPVFGLRENGILGGRVKRISPDLDEDGFHVRIPLHPATAFFVRDGAVQSRATLDSEGRFLIADMRAGDYTFVTAGPNGFAAFGVLALKQATPPKVGLQENRPITQLASSVRLVQNGTKDEEVSIDTVDPNDLLSQDLFEEEEGEGGGGGGVMAGGNGGAGVIDDEFLSNLLLAAAVVGGILGGLELASPGFFK